MIPRAPQSRRLTALLCCLLPAFSNLRASESIPLDPEAVLFMDLPVMTASKFEQTIANAPSVITVIDQTEIRNMGARTIQDVLNLVPGVEVNRGTALGAHDNITIRGRVNEYGEDILFMLDGQRMNDAQSGGGMVYLKHFPVHDIKRIEVIRGPGSSLYGSNAFAGIVNIITHEKVVPTESRISVAGGGFDAADGYVTLGDANFSLSARRTSDNGEEYRFDRGGNMAPGQTAKVKDPVKDNHDLGLRFHLGQFSLEADYAGRRTEGYLLAGFVDHAWDSPLLATQRDSSRSLRVQAQYDWRLSDAFSLIPSVRYNEGRMEFLSYAIPPGAIPAFVSPGANAFGLVGGPSHNSQSYETELQANWSLGSHNLVGGVLYQREDITRLASILNVNLFDPAAAATDPGTYLYYTEGEYSYGQVRGRDILGLYVQDTWTMTDRISFNFGVRHDDYSDFGDTVNPRAGIVFQATDSSNVKLLYGRAFRAPTFSELYQKNNPVTVGNTELKPQKVETFEVNLNHYPGQRLVNSLSLFLNRYKNLISYDTSVSPSPSLNLPENQRDLGAEWELRYRLSKYKYATLNFAHIDPQDKDGNLRPDIARNKAGVVLNYDVVPAKVVVNVNAFYRGGRINPLGAADPDHKVSDATVVNSTVRVLNLLPRLDLDVSCFDVTDEQWVSPGLPASSVPSNVPNRGFQWLARLTYTFR